MDVGHWLALEEEQRMATPNHEDRTVTEFLSARLHRVAAYDNDPYSSTIVEDYCNLVDHVIFDRGFGHSLFRVGPEELRATKSEVFMIREDHKILAAMHMARDYSGRFVWINGVVKADGQSGAMIRELMAASILEYRARPYEKVPFRACYRKFPVDFRDQFGKTRTKNDGSAKLFKDFMFKEIGTETVKVSGDFQDAHLTDFCNPNSNTFDVYKVESIRRTVHMAREYLRLLSQNMGRG